MVNCKQLLSGQMLLSSICCIKHKLLVDHGGWGKKYEHNRLNFLALQHSIIGKIKSIIGWCLTIVILFPVAGISK